MKRIEEILPSMYELMNQLNPSIPEVATSKPSKIGGISIETEALKPIAKLDEVLAGSPAAEGGVQENDLLLSFGPVNASSGSSPLNGIPDVVRQNVNQPINLVVKRGTDVVSLQIVPKTWSGRGLLGCHLTPI